MNDKITDERLAEIEAAAQSIGGGDWEAKQLAGEKWHVTSGTFTMVGECDSIYRVMRHIATSDPPTVLSLVAEVRRLREREADLLEQASAWDAHVKQVEAHVEMLEAALEGRFDLGRAMLEMAKALETETGVPFIEMSKPDQNSYIRIFEAALGALIYEMGGPPRNAPQREPLFIINSEYKPTQTPATMEEPPR